MASGRRITVTLDEAAERHLKGLKANSEMHLRVLGWTCAIYGGIKIRACLCGRC